MFAHKDNKLIKKVFFSWLIFDIIFVLMDSLLIQII